MLLSLDDRLLAAFAEFSVRGDLLAQLALSPRWWLPLSANRSIAAAGLVELLLDGAGDLRPPVAGELVRNLARSGALDGVCSQLVGPWVGAIHAGLVPPAYLSDLLCRPSLAVEIVGDLVDRAPVRSWLWSALFQNPSFGPDALEMRPRSLSFAGVVVRRRLRRDVATSSGRLMGLGANPVTPAATLGQLATSGEFGPFVAAHPSLPAGAQTRLLSCALSRPALAANRAIEPSVAWQLSFAEPKVLAALAANPSCPPVLLRQLAEQEQLLPAVCSNPSCPPEVFAAAADAGPAAALARGRHPQWFRSTPAGQVALPLLVSALEVLADEQLLFAAQLLPRFTGPLDSLLQLAVTVS